MLIVQKYGGTSLADGDKIRWAARRAAECKGAGHDLVIVVSAQGDTTDLLIEKAAQINKHRAAREMDAYLSAGEQMSVRCYTAQTVPAYHPPVLLFFY